MMYSSNSDSISIGDVLFHTAVQLSVPTVTSTASMATKLRSYSETKQPTRTRKNTYNFSTLSISFMNKRKTGRDPVTQPITHKTQVV